MEGVARCSAQHSRFSIGCGPRFDHVTGPFIETGGWFTATNVNHNHTRKPGGDIRRVFGEDQADTIKGGFHGLV